MLGLRSARLLIRRSFFLSRFCVTHACPFWSLSLPAQRTGLRKARRLSRPFLRAMAPPLALLLVARLALGKLLAKTIDPTLELLFGDDIIDV